MVKPSKKELKEQKENLKAIREKASHLIDRYLKAEDPEMKWIKAMESGHVKTAMGLTKLMMEKYGEDAKDFLAQIQHDRGYEHGKRMLARVKARGGDISQEHAGYRLHYWRCTAGIIELSCVNVHNDFSIY